MASLAVQTAVTQRLAAAWTATPIIAFNTSGETPANGSAFVQVQFPFAVEKHVGMAGVGNRTFREEGGIRIVLNYPRGAGSEDALDKIDQLRAIFRAEQFGGVRCFGANPPVINDDNELGQYITLSFVVEYYFDLLA